MLCHRQEIDFGASGECLQDIGGQCLCSKICIFVFTEMVTWYSMPHFHMELSGSLEYIHVKHIYICVCVVYTSILYMLHIPCIFVSIIYLYV